MALLNESERHGVISSAVSRLWAVHQGIDNFYNEPPFAERLKKISDQGAIPETIQEDYVRVIVGCRIGNGYGVSWAATPHYDEMIRSFSPREISIMIGLPRTKTLVGRRIQNISECRKRFVEAVNSIDSASVPSGFQADYDSIVKSRT